MKKFIYPFLCSTLFCLALPLAHAQNKTPILYDSDIVMNNVLYTIEYQFLDINNIRASFNAAGSHFWDIYGTQKASFEVPKGSGLNTMFTEDIWIGGLNNNSLHIAAQRYINGGNQDFWPGPIMDSANYSFAQDAIWNRLWKVNKCDIDSHIAYWNQPGYVAPAVIIDWPAHGDVSLGQAYNLAPFFDRTGNNIYDPYDGDYPIIKGDQAVYLIRNDERGVHTETGGAKLRVEIHEMAYAFNCPDDSALWNSIFMNYKIINRSNNTYDSTYIGVFGDFDIGCYSDDYTGSDVQRGSFFGYNGDALDEDGCNGGKGYGAPPPAQSITILKGPLMDPDSADNTKGGCDASVNGVGFGAGLTDNESWGMTRFLSFCNPSFGGCGFSQDDPSTAVHYYNYLRGFWKDGTRMVYGGNGHISNCTSCEYANFMYPGSNTFPQQTDPCFWGVCNDPWNLSCGVTPGSPTPWTEQNAGNAPGDRRGIGSTGPFTFSPGDTAEIDIALVFGRDYADTVNPSWASVVVMKERIDSIRGYFENNLTPCGGSPCSFSFTGIAESQRETGNIVIYPNPAKEELTIAFHLQSKDVLYTIYDITGREIVNGKLTLSENIIHLTHINRGIYILRIYDDEQTNSRKFVKM